MKVTNKTIEFNPVIIEIENKEELDGLRNILQTYLNHPVHAGALVRYLFVGSNKFAEELLNKLN